MKDKNELNELNELNEPTPVIGSVAFCHFISYHYISCLHTFKHRMCQCEHAINHNCSENG